MIPNWADYPSWNRIVFIYIITFAGNEIQVIYDDGVDSTPLGWGRISLLNGFNGFKIWSSVTVTLNYKYNSKYWSFIPILFFNLNKLFPIPTDDKDFSVDEKLCYDNYILQQISL